VLVLQAAPQPNITTSALKGVYASKTLTIVTESRRVINQRRLFARLIDRRITWSRFSSTKGHGLIKQDGGGEDIFVHISAVDGVPPPSPRLRDKSAISDDFGRPGK